jgi:hypothetical protein
MMAVGPWYMTVSSAPIRILAWLRSWEAKTSCTKWHREIRIVAITETGIGMTAIETTDTEMIVIGMTAIEIEAITGIVTTIVTVMIGTEIVTISEILTGLKGFLSSFSVSD